MPSLSRPLALAALSLLAACGIRPPGQQCRQVVSRAVACGSIAPASAAEDLAICTDALSQSSSACKHAYNTLVDCLENFDCNDLAYGACDDYLGDAAPVCPLMFVDEESPQVPGPTSNPNMAQNGNAG